MLRSATNFWGGSVVKNLTVMQRLWEILWVQFLGQEDPVEEGMATHSSTLAMENPIDRGACWASVHWVTECPTRLK